jgi:DNA-directed RNA polymerase subunit RPC12/RpoP
MGFVTGFGYCANCGKPFSFNPKYVPSIRINGEKEPVCRYCVERVNPIRKEKGIPEFKIHPEAYQPLDEKELP